MNACYPKIAAVSVVIFLACLDYAKADESASAPASTAVEAQMPTVAIAEGDAIQASSTPTPLQASDPAAQFLDQNPLNPPLDLSNREGELNPEEEAYAMDMIRQQFSKDTVTLMNPDQYRITVGNDHVRSFDFNKDYDITIIYTLGDAVRTTTGGDFSDAPSYTLGDAVRITTGDFSHTPGPTLFVHTNWEDVAETYTLFASRNTNRYSSNSPTVQMIGERIIMIPLSSRPEISPIRDFLSYVQDNLSVTAFPLRSKDYDQMLITPNFITLTTQADFAMNEQFFAEMLKRFEFLTPDFLKEKGISFNLEEFNNPENYLKLEFEELTDQAWDKLSDYQVIETINLNSLMIAYMILNPPDTVHPFLRALMRWFYGNSPMVQKYKNDRQRIIKMYQLAKDREDLKIQYVDEKGRRGIYETYLPRPDQGGFLSLIVVPTNSGQANAPSPQ